MSSTFFGFNIARSGLFASQRALNITSHNISNANTEGYSRQRLDIKQSSPMLLPNGQGMLGAGVETENVSQIRYEFLDFKYRGENMTFGEWESKFGTLDNIQAIFNEPSDSGIQTVIDQFFSSLHELSKTPESLTTRALVRERGIALASNLNHMAGQFEKLQSDTDFEIRTTVDEINGYSDQIRKLNESIYKAELDGSKANDLRDQRNLLVDKLSKLVNVDYYEDNQNRFHVLVNGKTLVSHFRNNKLTCNQRSSKLNPYDADKLNDIEWEDGSTFEPRSGNIKGLIDMRDNVSGNNKGIPYYMDKLNEFTNTFAKTINDIHKAGYNLNAPPNDTGLNFFTVDGMDSSTLNGEYNKIVDADVAARLGALPGGDTTENRLIVIKQYKEMNKELHHDGTNWVSDPIITASKIQISKEVEDSLNNIAASTTQAGVPGNGDNALAMADIRHDSNLFAWGSPEDYFKSLISNLGVDTQQAERMQNNQTVLLNQVETNRQSVSGVSLDEEMTNMIKFQHSFNANSRMITAMDEMIETIINRMGTVGR